MPAAPLKTKKTYHHGNLRAVLIQAGLDLIAESGVRAFTLREIGARVGVSRMAAYRHFADKAQLLAAIREAGFEKFGDALRAGREQASAPSFIARMNAMGVAYVRFARENPAYFEVMFGAHGSTGEPGESSEAGRRAFQILEETILEGQATGDLIPGDSKLMAFAAWSIVHGIGALKLDQIALAQGWPQSDQFVIACSNLLWHGVLAAQNKPQ